MAPRSSSATCLWLALAAAILALAQVRCSIADQMPPASSFAATVCELITWRSILTYICHAIVAVQAQGGSSAADLEKVTAKTFFDIEIDGKPAGSCMHGDACCQLSEFAAAISPPSLPACFAWSY